MKPAPAGNKKTFNAQYSNQLFGEHDLEQDRKLVEAQRANSSNKDGVEKRRIVVVLFRNDLRCVRSVAALGSLR